jgi:hypothetical protein
MLFRPLVEQIRAVAKTTHDLINVMLRNGLKNNPAEFVFEELDPGSRLNPMFPPEFGWNYELAF